jgi:hypothetical protein
MSDEVDLTALRDHFRGGGQVDLTPGVSVPHDPSRDGPFIARYSGKFPEGSTGGDGRLTIGCDGSADGARKETPSVACAVTNDGRWSLGVTAVVTKSHTSEDLAILLALDLARYHDRPLILTDRGDIVSSLRHVQGGQTRADVLPALAAAIQARSQEGQDVEFWYVAPVGGKHQTGATPTMNAAHRMSWLTRRLLECGADPAVLQDRISLFGARAFDDGNGTSSNKTQIRKLAITAFRDIPGFANLGPPP